MLTAGAAPVAGAAYSLPRVAGAELDQRLADRRGERVDARDRVGVGAEADPDLPEHEIAETRSAWRSAGSATE